MSLRPYQQDALSALDKGWAGGLLRLGVALPTGTGKTHIMTSLADASADRPGAVLWLVHRDELVNQSERRMREQATPGVTVGVVKAERDVVGASVVVASVHTLRSETRLARVHQPSLIIVDEAHVSMSPTYQRIFERFPNARVAGFTATWTRSDSKRLGDFWESIVYQRGIRWAIREGFLVPPAGIEIGAPADMLAGVRTRGGDYVNADLGEAVAIDQVRQNVVRGYREHAPSRPGVLFAPTRESAEYFGQALRDAGIPTAGIYAGTSPRHRRAAFSAYKDGRIKVLTTCTALAEGWDAPWCSVALMCRPTRHIGLYVQTVGRVLRPWPGKRDALVLDFVGGAQGMSLSLDAVLEQTLPIHDPDVLIDEDGLDPDEIGEQLDAEREDDRTFIVRKGARPVDLFAGTGARWLTTEGGVPFVATAQAYYFLCEMEDGWAVGQCSIDSLSGGRWLRQGMAAEEAMNYCAIVSVDDDPSIAGYDAPWRKTKKPSEGQMRYAASLGVWIDADDTRSTVADKLTIRRASVTLAPIGRTA